jgi:uncharacterized damage-inducible protein DinB
MGKLTLGEKLANELEHELAVCRQIFERLPTALLGWKPHGKSPSAGGLAVHIVDMVEWIQLAATTIEIDYAIRPPPEFEPTSSADLLNYFDVRAQAAVEAVRKIDDQAIDELWTVRHGERIFFSRPRAEVIRIDCLNHIIHHRGQLTVYFRLNDVTLPGVYGPNGEE